MVIRTPKDRMADLKYEVLISKDTNREAMRWCEDQFGKRWDPLDNRQGKWAMFWKGTSRPFMYRFCFTDKEDMLMFILRWGS